MTLHQPAHHVGLACWPECRADFLRLLHRDQTIDDVATLHQGVGRALIAAVAERARAGGASRVYWMTQETNTTAMRLYDRFAEKPGFLIYRQVFA